ncbi:hypothetical protein [Pedobacter gandavensis]|uniref:hypothetical protein n=1 Tax=Pedobacter gandavensis TaxID=2679963 RepID=UPI00292E3095|nr:hypothetical protein [Pedobacter gandavensis]
MIIKSITKTAGETLIGEFAYNASGELEKIYINMGPPEPIMEILVNRDEDGKITSAEFAGDMNGFSEYHYQGNKVIITHNVSDESRYERKYLEGSEQYGLASSVMQSLPVSQRAYTEIVFTGGFPVSLAQFYSEDNAPPTEQIGCKYIISQTRTNIELYRRVESEYFTILKYIFSDFENTPAPAIDGNLFLALAGHPNGVALGHICFADLLTFNPNNYLQKDFEIILREDPGKEVFTNKIVDGQVTQKLIDPTASVLPEVQTVDFIY